MFEKLITNPVKNMHIVSGFEMKQKAKKFEDEGKNVIHLEIGEPDFNAPAHIATAGSDAFLRGECHYTPPLGILPLRKGISNYANTYKNISSTFENVVVTPGAKPIIFYTFLAFLSLGDEVIIPSPGFPIYSVMAKYQGATVKYAKAREEVNFRLEFSDIEKLVTEKTKLIILSTPNNPTGAIMEREELKKLNDFLSNKNIIILSDEIYDRLYYGDTKPTSIKSFKESEKKTIILDGFSKAYAMTGHRLGYGIMDQELVKYFNPLIVASNSCVSAPVQYAGLAAYEGPQDDVEAMRLEFKERRDMFVKGLNSINGLSCANPDGAFYALPSFKSLNKTSSEICDLLLEKAFISSLPGSTFGPDLEGYVRFSFATKKSLLEESLNRIEDALKIIKRG